MFLNDKNNKWENKEDQEPTNLKDGIIIGSGGLIITKLEEVIETRSNITGEWEQILI